MQGNKKQCAFCKSILFDDDDVVYCPVCGAPHHRECYASCGHCALEDKHGTPEQYGASQDDRCASETGAGHSPRDREGHVCPYCGKTSTSDTLFCPYCGRQFGENGPGQTQQGANQFGGAPFGQTPFGTPYQAFMPDPLGGVDPGDNIDGIPVSDMAGFVRVNTGRYIPMFKGFSQKGAKKRSWNWPAFLFPYAWLFYRKCYKEGIVTIVLSMVSSLLSLPASNMIYAYLASQPLAESGTAAYASAYAASYDTLVAAVGNITPAAWALAAAGLVLGLVLRIVLGIMGDHIYYTHTVEKIKSIAQKDTEGTLGADYHTALLTSGGVNLFLAMIVIYPMFLNFFSMLFF
jgi:RNA polymerase subunit RPABC4/transcription elongation factor Spt4